MKWFFAASAVAIALLWALAVATLPDNTADGRTPLSWSTDPNPARRAQIAPFEEANPDLAILVEPVTVDKTIIQCSTGVGPDIIEVYSTEQMVTFIDAGILLDLTPYAAKMGFGPESTYPKLVGNLMYEGRQYRYPANAASQVLMYNKRMFREAGVAEPSDGMLWDDFIELIKPLTVKRDSGRGYEQFALLMSKGYARDIHLQYGAHFFAENGTVCVLDSPESIAAMQFFYDLMVKHEVIPTPAAAEALSAAGGWGVGEIRWFAAEKSACIWGSRWMMVILRQYPELQKEIGVALLPRMPGGVPASYSGTRGPGINANSERIDEALRFLQYLASDEYAEVIAMSSDGLPPQAAYTEDPSRLLNPKYPWEDFQQKFIDSMSYAEPPEVSPFVSSIVVDRAWTDAIDNVQNGLMEPEEAMKAAARTINDRIAANIAERPDLAEKYRAARRDFDSPRRD
ncbi:MAG: multiple sugar transport system substrate-binding protein [Candidatus Sumerlaeota bacterium]|nr:multiple sugar transport system substrate-binding protein [Candidatus Sumerlaeota bacterium]